MPPISSIATAGALLALVFAAPAFADPTVDDHHPESASAAHRAAHERHMQDMTVTPPSRDSAPGDVGPAPALSGQDAFGAIQAIVALLEADPGTDWTKIDLAALREHLIDMNKLTLEASAVARPVEGGLQMDITGSGRTLDAIRHMIPAHARELARVPGWTALTETLNDGVRLTVTAPEPREAAHIRGLGFIGLMASGAHHQAHHLAMAKGEHVH